MPSIGKLKSLKPNQQVILFIGVAVGLYLLYSIGSRQRELIGETRALRKAVMVGNSRRQRRTRSQPQRSVPSAASVDQPAEAAEAKTADIEVVEEGDGDEPEPEEVSADGSGN